MKFLIVNNIQSTSLILSKIIHDYNWGEITNCSYTKFFSNNNSLNLKDIDILIISLPIPIYNKLILEFNGIIIGVCDINDQDSITQGYLSGVENFITKPINQFQVRGTIKNLVELINLKKCIYNIEKIVNPTKIKTHINII
ncbi:histidine kinase [Clostridium sp. P21]|uniref:Histidine kinase n=1 Tax=Clostridium muellerianum TaxID=2716538 RepID=A0A7Y0EH88_9CLOT|nr:histidine kinase [Clostridium muellerianum]NMM62410.1 histidine kinase [Clostridium muellerianum]